MKNPPCLNCSERSLGCHDQCNLYKKYSDTSKNKNSQERDFEDYLNDAIRRMKGSSSGIR